MKFNLGLIIALTTVACSNLSTPPAKVYSFNNETCIEGTVRTGYTSAILNCSTSTQTCLNGVWVGPQLFETCVEQNRNCGPVPHGTIQTGYFHPNTPKNVPCPTGTKQCINGEWVGPMLFDSCTELP